MRLFVAEKPSLARAIADVLPGPQQRRDGFIVCGRDDVVAWCAGHILELAPPDAYDAAYRRWTLEHLPIIPEEWRLVASAPDLLKTIRGLLPKASRVVHAGDPDREGQLLIDEVLVFLGYRGPVDRVLISDLNPPAVRKALAELQPNSRFRSLYDAALARQRADWLFGINLTRLYTVLGRAGGYDGVLSVGRVQTPLLGLIVRRDREIERFAPRTYFVPRASLRADDRRFHATWHPPDDPGPILDNDGRLTNRAHAERIRSESAGRAGVVQAYSRDARSESAPLPYSLPDLQIDAGKRLGLGPKRVLDACQALYETHRMLTYPRSDCAHLPEGQWPLVTGVFAAVARNAPELAPLVTRADRARRSRAWDDKKVSAHHAIIPTAILRPGASLSSTERDVYDLVSRRFLAQFYPPFEFLETTIDVQIEGERFRARGRQIAGEGWRELVLKRSTEPVPQDDDADDDEPQALPLLREGASVMCDEIVLAEKRTAPPKRFTEGSLIQAMTGIGRFVEEPNIKQLLKETDGIGTPATQAQIIQTLFDRGFIERRGRQIQSTAVGRALVAALPEVATRPDMTALWEAAMRRIADGQTSLPAFLSVVVKQLRELVATGRARGRLDVPSGAARGHAQNDGASKSPRRRRMKRRP